MLLATITIVETSSMSPRDFGSRWLTGALRRLGDSFQQLPIRHDGLGSHIPSRGHETLVSLLKALHFLKP